jgi:hypothetical protein
VAYGLFSAQADYVLAAKGNQNHLFEDTVCSFDWARQDRFNPTSQTVDGMVGGSRRSARC